MPVLTLPKLVAPEPSRKIAFEEHCGHPGMAKASGARF